jgi:hypothetical protein
MVIFTETVLRILMWMKGRLRDSDSSRSNGSCDPDQRRKIANFILNSNDSDNKWSNLFVLSRTATQDCELAILNANADERTRRETDSYRQPVSTIPEQRRKIADLQFWTPMRAEKKLLGIPIAVGATCSHYPNGRRKIANLQFWTPTRAEKELLGFR